MKQHVVSGMLCLAMAGCAQSRSALTKEDSKANPVALNPVPSIYDTVNHGMGGKALIQTAMANPDDAHWSGRAQVAMVPKPTSAGPEGTPRGASSSSPASSAATGAGMAQASAASQPTQSASSSSSPGASAMAGNDTAVANRPSADLMPSEPMQSPGSAPAASSPTEGAPIATAAPAPGQPAGGGPDRPIVAVSNLPPIPDMPSAGGAAGPGGTEGTGQARVTAAGGLASAAVPAASGVATPSPSTIPLEASNAKPPLLHRERDPLLGPDPEVLPRIDDVPPLESAGSATPKSTANLTAAGGRPRYEAGGSGP
jgi:hypothetical protein